ncbi:cytochrome b/b6 domain-containing protein [Paracoccaceae bacterium Fryx2]|nr:cytochrome b/b6 domain-containing protein [Paracoccaceae bacterium Fryx2]
MGSPEKPTVPLETVRLWDPFLRLFHWALLVAVVAAWGLGKFGPNVMTLHFWLGYAVAGLLAFRVVWGLIGPPSARFGSLFYRPATMLGYLRKLARRSPSHWRGHNPLGGLFVAALLLVLLAQVATGLFADPEDYMNAGPLAGYAGIDMARTALAWHGLLGTVLLIMVGVHVAAIVGYKVWKHEDLIRPMITGRKRVRTRAEVTPAAKAAAPVTGATSAR